MTRDATSEELRLACVESHVDWLVRLTEAAGGVVQEREGLLWARTDEPQPELTVAVLGEPDAALLDRIDAVLDAARDGTIEMVGVWAPDGSHDAALAPWLEARGLRAGERPNWMAVDLRRLPAPPPLDEIPPERSFTLPTSFDMHLVPELPCYGEDTSAIRQAMVDARPRRVWHAVLWDSHGPAGQVSLNATDGPLGVLGLHNLIVLPRARTRGLGLARFEWVQRFALDLGCRYLVGNAFDEVAVLERMMGFRDVGTGRTWWAGTGALAGPLDPERVRLAESVAVGDVAAVTRLVAGWNTVELDRSLPSGVSPLRCAAAWQRPAIARLLLDAGATPDVLAAWDLGWRDDARALLRADPTARGTRSTRSGKTLLHVAVERDDPELAAELLAGGVDPTLCDRRFGTTPRQWATSMGRRALLAILPPEPQ